MDKIIVTEAEHYDIYKEGYDCGYQNGLKSATEKFIQLLKEKAACVIKNMGNCDEDDYVALYTIADYQLERIVKEVCLL